jgi:glycolate oxidase iron-sulfur subunit
VTTAGGCAAHLASVLGRERVKEFSQWLVDRERPRAATSAEPSLDRGEARALVQAPAETDDPGASQAEPPRDPGELPRLAAPARNGAAAGEPADGRPRIGLQDSCHLRNALGVWREPRELIARIGEYVELPSAAACCGAAGSYAILRPKDSARVLDRHLDEIADADLDMIAVVNPGCYRQLQQGVKRRRLRTRVLHLAELLAGEK